MTQAEKNTCQLFIQTDHLFFKYYKTREAVIAQVTHTRQSLGTGTNQLWRLSVIKERVTDAGARRYFYLSVTWS